jgi:hypothetical protein
VGFYYKKEWVGWMSHIERKWVYVEKKIGQIPCRVVQPMDPWEGFYYTSHKSFPWIHGNVFQLVDVNHQM